MREIIRFSHQDSSCDCYHMTPRRLPLKPFVRYKSKDYFGIYVSDTFFDFGRYRRFKGWAYNAIDKEEIKYANISDRYITTYRQSTLLTQNMQFKDEFSMSVDYQEQYPLKVVIEAYCNNDLTFSFEYVCNEIKREKEKTRQMSDFTIKGRQVPMEITCLSLMHSDEKFRLIFLNEDYAVYEQNDMIVICNAEFGNVISQELLIEIPQEVTKSAETKDTIYMDDVFLNYVA